MTGYLSDPADLAQHQAAFQAQEDKAVQTLLEMGVTLGAPVYLTGTQKQVGHMMCAFHLVNANGQDIDGGAASTLLGLLSDGTYGEDPATVTMHPCRALTFGPEDILTDGQIAEIFEGFNTPEQRVALVKALMAHAWDESHGHCTDLGCTNPYQP